MGRYIKRLAFAATIFVASHYVFVRLVDFLIWFTDEDQMPRYITNKEFFDFLYDVAIPYVLAAYVTIRYIKKVFYIPSFGEAIRWVLSFIFLSWGWLIIEYFWDLY